MTLRLDPAQKAAAARLDDLQKRLLKSPRDFGFWTRRMLRLFPGKSTIEPARGLYLWGGVGRGKTMLMDRFFDALPFQDRERKHFHRFMHDVHGELRRLKASEHPLEIVAHRIAKRARIICFDELNVADIADAMILGTLFDALFRRGVTLVATSNVAPKDLYRDGLQRARFLPAIELIEKHTEVVHVDGGTDYRLRQLRKAATYRVIAPPPSPSPASQGRAQEAASHPLPREAGEGQGGGNAWLEQTFLALAGEPGVIGGTVTVDHRRIPCMRQSDGIIWFDFYNLCEGARSQNDYIELARCYHTVLLSDVPVMDENAENPARRFIALIDELYDRNVNLVLTAAAPADAIYKGSKLKFEFQRTLSRLVEMQSEEFLAREHKP